MAARKKTRPRDIARQYTGKVFAKKLRSLAEAVEAGKAFRISVKGERVLVPPDALLSIEHERGKTDEEIEFQLTWKRP